MKILFIVPYIPNLIRVRSYNLIRYLTLAGHEVTLATLWSSEEELRDLEGMRQICQTVIAMPMPRWRSMLNSLIVLASPAPIQSAYSWNPELAKAIYEESAKGYDIIHVEHLRGVRYGLYLLSHAQTPSIPIVWDAVDNIAYLFRQAASQSKNMFRRWFFNFEARRTEYYEASLPGRFTRSLVTSKIDLQEFNNRLNLKTDQSNMVVLPNGADLDYFTPNDTIKREENTLVITGKMSYHANIQMVLHFTNRIMPKIWAEIPDVKLWIVGKDPSRAIEQLKTDSRITVTGTVPDIRPYIWRATVAIAPLIYGAGIQNKVIEAMACATPLVASSRSIAPLENITPGRDLLCAENDEEFAQMVVDLLRNPEKRHQLAQAGRKYVEDHHHWRVIVSALVEIYQDSVRQFKTNNLYKEV